MGVRWAQMAAIAICLLGGCKPKPPVDVAKVRGDLEKRFPERRFAQWNGESGTVSFKAQLTNLGVYSVQINRNGRTCTAVAKYQSTAADKIAPVVYVSAFDGAGKEIGRWDIVKHTLADLVPGATDTTEDFFTLPEGAEPVLMAVDDDAQPRAGGVAASRDSALTARKPPIENGGSPDPWVSAIGRIDAGVTVYFRDTPKSEPHAWFTVINPYVDGDAGPLMLVKYSDTGNTELLDRRATMRSPAALAGQLVVKR